MNKLEFSNKFVNSNDILDRLKKALNMRSDAELARFLEVNPSTVATWRVKQSMKFDRIIEYSRNIDLNWLFKGEETQKKCVEEFDLIKSDKDIVTHKSVRYYRSIAVNPDQETEYSEAHDLINVKYPKSFIDNELDTEPENIFITRAIGDTMEPTIRNRDFIMVQKSCDPPFAGRIYLLRIDDSIQCKRLNELPGNKLLIMNDNARYEDIQINRAENDFNIIGRVIAYSRTI